MGMQSISQNYKWEIVMIMAMQSISQNYKWEIMNDKKVELHLVYRVLVCSM